MEAPPPLTEPDPIVIPAENKREKALELAKEGKGAAEIARLIDAKIQYRVFLAESG